MQAIKIYTSRKKSFGILVLMLIMVALCGFAIWKGALFYKVVGGIGVLFFGLGIFVSISRIIKSRLFLTIDSEGVDLNPGKANGKISWQDVDGFSELKIKGTKIIVIYVANPEYWIENEKSTIRKKLMKFNLSYYGSPFNISSGVAQISYDELLALLWRNWKIYG